jgi:hypothetical protein
MDPRAANDLLCRCLRTAGGEIEAAELERLSSDDWDALLVLAARHHATPLLYHRLDTRGLGAVLPAGAAQRLRKAYVRSGWRNAKLHRELGRVLARLREDGVPVIVLKGAHLAQAIYRNLALRPMGDLDLLVRDDDLAHVESRLLQMGYQPSIKDSKHHDYWLPAQNLLIEVHRHILGQSSPFKIDAEPLWERAQPLKIAGVRALVLSPEDLLLYLCFHAVHHRFRQGLKPLCDIDAILWHYREQIDWRQVRQCARQWGVGHAL